MHRQIKGPVSRPQRMRYTKTALLIFGAGLVVGLAVVTFGIDWFGRLASGTMAFGIAALPAGGAADLWFKLKAALRRPTPRATAARRRAAAASRSARPRMPGPKRTRSKPARRKR